MALLDRTGYRRLRLVVVAAITAIGVLAITWPAPAGAAENPPATVETLNPASPGRPGRGPDTHRRDHAPVTDGSSAYVYRRGRFSALGPIPDASATLTHGINNLGQIVGGDRDGDGNQHGFLLDRGRYRTIDAPSRPDSIGTLATTINDRGEIVIPEPGGEGVVPVAT